MASRFKAGEWAEVRSADEILATLDDSGALDSLPFQPEFLQYCGRRYRVFRTAHRTCDTLNWGPGRNTPNAVYLDLRCDGAAHNGCQAECLILWKDAWLKPVEEASTVPREPSQPRTGARSRSWLEAKTHYADPTTGETRYKCQATEHVRASRPVKGFDLLNRWRDVSSGNTTFGQLVKGSLLLAVWRLRFLPFGWRAWVSLYAALHRALYKQPDPHIAGKIPLGEPTPAVALDLKVGEYARVRSLPEIAATLNTANQNRGLKFNPELAVFCGRAGRVTSRVERIVDEKTGKMLHFKNPCIILENTYCQARYVPQALHCPRRSLQYYREAWLERAEPPAAPDGQRPS